MSNDKYPTHDVEVTLAIPTDYSFDREEKEWVMYLCEKAAEIGSTLENAAAFKVQLARKEARIEGAKEAQKFVLELAGSSFAAGDDEKARSLRDVAGKMNQVLSSLEEELKRYRNLEIEYKNEVRNRRAEASR